MKMKIAKNQIKTQLKVSQIGKMSWKKGYQDLNIKCTEHSNDEMTKKNNKQKLIQKILDNSKRTNLRVIGQESLGVKIQPNGLKKKSVS